MKKEKKWWRLQTVKQMNMGAGISGIGFLLYLAVSAMKLGIIRDLVVIVFAMVSTWVFVSVADGRKKNKEAVSYNLLWGTGALAIMMVFLAFATIRMRLGL